MRSSDTVVDDSPTCCKCGGGKVGWSASGACSICKWVGNSGAVSRFAAPGSCATAECSSQETCSALSTQCMRVCQAQANSKSKSQSKATEEFKFDLDPVDSSEMDDE